MASVRASSAGDVNANWGGVIEPNTFGTHEFMDFVEQIGAEAFLRQCRLRHAAGSGGLARIYDHRPADARWPRSARRTAMPSPTMSVLGIGNENWGCGGTMTPDYYVEPAEDLRPLRRNYNAAAADEATHRRGDRTGPTPAIPKP